MLLLPLTACEIAPSQVAKECGISEPNFDAMFEAVGGLSAGESRVAGKCTFQRVTGSERVVVFITKTGGGIFPVGSN